MKKLKTKISLSMLALAFLGAGAFSLQSDATVSAATDYGTGLRMEEGAAICLENDFNGIRWTTKVKANAAFEGAQFGVLVAPSKTLSGTELTHETANAMDLALAPEDVDATTETATYHSIISYDDLEANLGEAYALELTARAYVNVDGEYYYANISKMSTSRSARAVAIAAELSGYLDDAYRKKDQLSKADTAVTYYRKGEPTGETYIPSVKSTGAVNSAVIDSNAPTEEVAIPNFEIEGEVDEVFIGAERVSHKYDAATKTLSVKNTAYTPEGEQYVTVFTTDGEIYTHPAIVATKVLTSATDLEMFHAKGEADESSSKDKILKTGEIEYTGYYVLGNDIEADGYSHGSKNYDNSFNNASWSAYTSYAGKAVGLRGTFNGMGYSIKDMTIGSVREGLFGVVNGGTIKNVAVTNLKAGNTAYMYAFAQYLIGATIENVYIQTNAYVEGDEANPGFILKNSAGLAYAAYDNTKIKNVVIDYQTAKDNSITKTSSGITLTTSGSDASYTYENVYCVSGNKVRGLKINTTNSYQSFPHGLSHTTYVAATDSAAAKNGYCIWGENGSTKTVDGYDISRTTGALIYTSLADMYTAQKDNDAYKALANTGCWTVAEDGTLTWEIGTVTETTPSTPSIPSGPANPNSEPTAKTKDMKKILLIGNSHATDTFTYLPTVFAAEGYNDYTFGLATRGSCTINMHATGIDGGAKYTYGVCTPSDNLTFDKSKNGSTLGVILKDVAWDIVYIQTGSQELTMSDMNKSDRDIVVNYIKETCENPDVKIGYSCSWIAPYVDSESDRDAVFEDLGTDDFWGPILVDENNYEATKHLLDYRRPIRQHNKNITLFENNIFTDDTYFSNINTGTAILYANQVLGLPARDATSSKPSLYRDRFHLSDGFGRTLASYAFFSQYMGVEINYINVDVVNGVTFTEEMKGYMLEALNFSQTNAWTKWDNEEPTPV